MSWLVTDRGSHFRYLLMKRLTGENTHWSLAYYGILPVGIWVSREIMSRGA